MFALEPHGPDTYVGQGPRYPWGGLYGGQIVAQALRAASETVEAGFEAHSIRAYFIRRGDHTEPVRYEVDRIRNGRSFVTRRVVARQAVGAILNAECSFQRPEGGVDVQAVRPPDVPSPGALVQDSWTEAFDRCFVPPDLLDPDGRTGSGRTAAWLRVNGELGAPVDAPSRALHQCWLAYLSDDLPTDAVRRAHPVASVEGEWEHFFGTSLDHTIWFHRPMRADRWHLHDFACHQLVGTRGLAVGHVFDDDGEHVATVAQEVLLRDRRAARPG
jgi:acyl-CoA thioesterase-2